MYYFTVHLLFLLRWLNSEKQKKFLVWENIYAVTADNEETAVGMAIDFGKENMLFEDSGLRNRGQPARWEYLGVRKCLEMDFRTSFSDEVPKISQSIVGEATFLELEFSSLEKIDKYLKGKKVSMVVYK